MSGCEHLVNFRIGGIQYEYQLGASNNQYVNGNIELIFNDGTSFKAVDNVDECWYKLEGIVFQRRTF